jgi:hypothetical protein
MNANEALALRRETAVRKQSAVSSHCRRLAFLIFGLAIAATIGAQTKPHTPAHAPSAAEQVIAAERETQVDASKFDLQALHNLLLPEFIQADNQILTRGDVLDQLQRASVLPCTFGVVKMDHVKVTFLEPTIATLVYHYTQPFSCRGRSASADANVSTVWVNRDGRWRAQLHTEIFTSIK